MTVELTPEEVKVILQLSNAPLSGTVNELEKVIEIIKSIRAKLEASWQPTQK